MRSGRLVVHSVPMTDSSRAGEARRLATAVGARVGLGEADLGKLAIVVTELARNLVAYATAGQVIIQPLDGAGAVGVEVLALDRGPGIANVAECLRDGYSTAGTPGTGLGAVRRLSTLFEIHSIPGVGTAAVARISSGSAAHAPTTTPGSEVGGVCLPMPGEDVSGDGWAVHHAGTRSRILVADGLGHGPSAGEAAEEAIATFRRHARASPAEALGAVHAALRHTRGAAAAVAQLDPVQGEIRFTGVGNIAGAILSSAGSRRLVSHNGIAGHQAPRIQEFTYGWPADGLLVMHSDGLTSRWSLDPYPGLASYHPGLVAGVLYRDFARGRDDVTVVVARNEPGGLTSR